MHSLFKGVIVIFGLALASCSLIPLCPAATKEQAQQAEAALDDFAVNLYKNVTSQDTEKNQCLSPVSISLALALVENGADGKTRQQLKDALVGIGSTTDVLTAYRAIQKQLRIDDKNAKLAIANGLFQDKTLQLKDTYVSKTRDCLETKIDDKNDFVNELEQTREKINKWIADQTNGRIHELYKKGTLSKAARLVLANAVYFKSSWLNSFDKSKTKHMTFYKHGQDQDTQIVPFMRANGTYPFASTADADTLELDYQHPSMAFYVVLPKARDGLRAFEQKLTGQSLKAIISGMRRRDVAIQMPKFVVRSKIELKTVFSKMNLDNMFDNTADLSRMCDKPLKVDGAIHEGYIHVHENGTEAAAATGISITTATIHIPRDPAPFTVDHPFLYLVLHKQTNAVVFLGRVTTVEAHNEDE